ncbi:hypothetical protein C365_05659 [Cryptococcus neoformans Bt85]|nr:hypothetical protein C365_05659 [Cryptococcus neoformans var. grubii Bt85]OXM76581.1 hypothetical protein C364_05659 [Cryptococcus neoformans var. grubii Bt63]
MMMAPKRPEDSTCKPIRFQLVSRFPNRTLSISRHIPPVRVEYTSSISRIDFIIALGISIFSPSFTLAEAEDDREGRGPS